MESMKRKLDDFLEGKAPVQSIPKLNPWLRCKILQAIENSTVENKSLSRSSNIKKSFLKDLRTFSAKQDK